MKSLCIMYVAGTHGRIEEYFRLPRNEVTNSCGPPHRCWELNLGPAIFLLPFLIILNL